LAGKFMANRVNIPDDEQWRVVPSKPDIEASSWGRIKRKSRVGKMPHGGARMYAALPTYGCVRKSNKAASHTYKGYHYRGIGNVKVHRMVCEAFHGSAPAGKPYVLHLDENAHNNRPENLKWGTQKENLNMPKHRQYLAQIRGSRRPKAATTDMGVSL
jgi:hypothetical protein